MPAGVHTLADGLRYSLTVSSMALAGIMTSIMLTLTPRQSYHIYVTNVDIIAGTGVLRVGVSTCYCTLPCMAKARESDQCPTGIRTVVYSGLISLKDGIGHLNLRLPNVPD